MAAILVFFFVCLQISPCCPILKLEIGKSILLCMRLQGLICKQTKKILKWQPFWKKVHALTEIEIVTLSIRVSFVYLYSIQISHFSCRWAMKLNVLSFV